MWTELVSYLNTQLNTNSQGGLDFNVTASRQIYEQYLRNMDDEKYIPVVVSLVAQPPLVEDVGISTSVYTVQFHCRREQLNNLELTRRALTNGATFSIGSESAVIYFGGFSVDYTEDAQGYAEGMADVYMTIQVNIVKGSVASNVGKLELKTTGSYAEVPFTNVVYRNDKALIPNVSYGTNNSSKAVSESYTFTFPLITSNTMLTSVLSNILSDSYNVKYTMKHTIVSGTFKEMDVVLRAGGFVYNDNAEPITFWVTFERALERKTITIDNVSLPLVNLSYGFNGAVLTGKAIDGVYGVAVPNGSKTIQATIIYTGNSKDTDLINEINRTTREVAFVVAYQVGSTTYTETCIVTNGTVTILENGDVSYTVTFSKRA